MVMNQQTLQQMAQGDLFGSNMRVLYKSDGEPWFVAKDVCEILQFKNYRDAVSRLDADERGVGNADTLGGVQSMSIVNESGLFHLIFISRNPCAKFFRRWVTDEVLPSIRKTGLYAGDAAGLAEALMTSRNYAQVRGLAGSVHGLGITAMAVCRRSGLAWRARRKKGHEFPVAALDRAADGRRAERGPLAARPDGAVFFYGQAAAAQNGGEA